MTTTITRIAARLQAHTELSAAFTEEQILFLQRKLLPEIEEAMPKRTHWIELAQDLVGPAGVKKTKSAMRSLELTPVGKSAVEIARYLGMVNEALKSVAGRGTPAARAAGLKRALKEDSWTKRKPQMAMRNIAMLMKKVPQNALTPEGKKLFQFLNSQHFKLLGKSWSWILQECENEFGEILKSAGLVMFGDGLNVKTVFRAMQKLPELKGWDFKFTPSAGKYSQDDYTATSPDGMTRFQLEDAGNPDWRGGNPSFTIKPSYQLKPDGGWYSWARTGVDSGGFSFEGDTQSLNLAVEEMLEKIAKARERAAALDSGGEAIDFGPIRRRYLPADAKNVIDTLKEGKIYRIEPSGFGTAYAFTIHRNPRNQPAGQDISKRVGKQVYYESFDMD